MNLVVGSIFWNNDFMFNNPNNKHFERPCIVLCIKENFIYFLPLAHSHGEKTKYFELLNNKNQISYIPLINIYKKPEKINYNEMWHIKKEDLFNLLYSVYMYHTSSNLVDPDFLAIKEDIEETPANLPAPCLKR